jgi:hypothetical protein
MFLVCSLCRDLRAPIAVLATAHNGRIFMSEKVPILVVLGIDVDGTVHLDHRPFASFWEAWREAGFPQPIEYEADRLLLHIDMLPDGDADEVRLIERASDAANTNDRLPVREIES